jgi:hypothetical protein
MVYEKKKMREKIFEDAIELDYWDNQERVEFFVSGGDTLEDLQDCTETTLAYWRQNHRQYPPARLWDIFLL